MLLLFSGLFFFFWGGGGLGLTFVGGGGGAWLEDGIAMIFITFIVHNQVKWGGGGCNWGHSYATGVRPIYPLFFNSFYWLIFDPKVLDLV